MGTICRDQMVPPLSQAVAMSDSRMGDVVNLRLERKRVGRLQKSKSASDQRAKHGVTKQQRMLAKALDSKTRRQIDEHRLETGETK